MESALITERAHDVWEYATGVYLDTGADQHVTFLFDGSGDEITVHMMNAFGEGLVHEFNIEEFRESVDELWPVASHVVANPYDHAATVFGRVLDAEAANGTVPGYNYEDIAYLRTLAQQEMFWYSPRFIAGEDAATAINSPNRGDTVEVTDDSGRVAVGRLSNGQGDSMYVIRDDNDNGPVGVLRPGENGAGLQMNNNVRAVEQITVKPKK